MRKIRYLAIHCSATKANINASITLPGEDIGAAEIRRWHMSPERGYSDIGYHYVIRRNGALESGRPLKRVGAHVSGHNSGSIGICLVGGLDERGQAENNFEPRQWESLKALLTRLKADFPEAIIQGHRDFPSVKKDCPCFDARKWAKDEGLA